MNVKLSLNEIVFLSKAATGLQASAQQLAEERDESWRLQSATRWASIASACAEAIEKLEALADSQ